jgi:signal transduction histidine kinase/ActR/RegA family two-component response regulator
VIEKGLIFLFGGLIGLLIMFFFRRRSVISSGETQPERETSGKADNKTNLQRAASADTSPEEKKSISAASLQILYDLNKSLDSTLDIYTIIDQALSSAISITESKKADYFRYQAEDNTLNLVRSIGRDSSEIEEINQNLSRGEVKTNLKWVLEHKKSILISDSGKDPIWEQIGSSKDQISSILTVPVLIGQELDGMISLMHPDRDNYSREQKELLTAIAHQVSLAINNAQRFVEVAFLLNSLKAKQELQDKLFEHIPVGVLLLDNQFNILSGNQQGLDFVNILQPDFDQISIARLGEKTIDELVERSKEPLPVDLRKDENAPEIFEVQLRSAQTIEGQYWILMISDVTEERGIKSRIRIQERLATLGRFAAGITHDFNNILSAILVYSDVIVRDPQLSEQNRSRMNSIREQSKRATDLIGRILDFSRNQPVEHKPFGLIPFLEETCELLTQVIPEDIQIRLEVSASSEILPILGDPARLQQMVMNLTLNSRDAMTEGGLVEILVEPVDISDIDSTRYPGMDPGSWVLMQVKDNGIGISPQDQARIFEPFFTTKSAQGGIGLGLAQVYGIVKQHQGFIDLESAPGSGTTFKIYLPLFPGEVEDTPEALPEVKLDGRGELLLVVEDDESLKEALWNLFEDHEFQVLQAANGEQGFDIVKQIGERISLVISDVVMPKMGGVELYQKTRKIYPEKKFIFITGHPSKIIDGAIDQDPYTRLLQKPFSMTDILILVQEIRDAEEIDPK